VQTDTLERIKTQIDTNPLLVYMKGTPQFPQCGFSAQVAKILKLCQAKFEFVNILENPDIRQELPKFANWPTFPQVYLKGTLIGGCDIVTELYESGELQTMLEQANLN
jgi:monothiol glutaredoxin